MKNMPFMRRLNLGKNSNEPTKESGPANQGFSTIPDWKSGLNWMTLMGVGVAFLMGLSGLFSVTIVLQDIQSNSLWAWQGTKVIPVNHLQGSDKSSRSIWLDKDNLSGGHLAKNVETESRPLGLDKDNLPGDIFAKGIEKESQSLGLDKDNLPGDLSAKGIEKESRFIEPDRDNLPGDLLAKGIEEESQSIEPDKDNFPGDLLAKGIKKESQSIETGKDNLPNGPTDHDKESQSVDLDKGNLLGGLLATGFEKKSCLSRYQSSFYRKELPYKPASYLLSKLRAYEDLHKRCGPNTESYNKVVELITTSQQLDNASDCNYLVWISFSGLENRILSIASAFLYAMLTDRVLLIDRGTDIGDLFCEPFPDSSWLLPLGFPLINQFNQFTKKSPLSYGNMLRNYIISDSTLTYPPYLYLHLVNDYDNYDKLFFCDRDQRILHKVPWLIMKTDNYFIPSLFLMSSFKQQLRNLFPQKDTVFHFLGRYLFHPTNSVWGLITRYYDTYLANADERVGIQINVSDTDTGPAPIQHVLDQILACTTNEGLLPQHNEQEEVASLDGKQKLKAVLVNSLSSEYYESLKSMYWESPTLSGEVVSVYQPNHKEDQQTDNQMQNRKALAEMYLLSLTDYLVTSSWSTFGYVAQGLGGHRPWILYKLENQTTPNPPCQVAMSMEPCFHSPPSYICKTKNSIDTGRLVPHVRHCEDMSSGLKLVDN